jgi:hypothetical protein
VFISYASEHLPGHWPMPMFLAAIYAQLEGAAAASSGNTVAAGRRHFVTTGRADVYT